MVLTTDDLARAGKNCDLLEDYPERDEGHTVLLTGVYGPGKPVHLVVNLDAYERDWSEPLTVVTVYVPEPPEWLDETT